MKVEIDLSVEDWQSLGKFLSHAGEVVEQKSNLKTVNLCANLEDQEALQSLYAQMRIARPLREV